MDLKSRCKNLAEYGRKYKDAIITTAVLLLIFFIGLGTGFAIKSDKAAPIIIDKNAKIGLPAEQLKKVIQASALQLTNGNFIASTNGKSYYPKDCLSAKRIKEENKIWFDSAKEAEDQGYKPAQNCF